MADGILRQDRHTEGGDQLVDAVIDLRIQVIGTTCQYHALHTVFFYVMQRLFALGANLAVEGFVFRSGLFHRLCRLRCGNAEGRQKLSHAAGQPLIDIVGQEGMFKADVFLQEDVVHIVSDHFRIRSDDGTVVVVRCRRVFRPLVVDVGVENPVHLPIHQPLDVTVNQFRRIAGRIGGNGLHSRLVQRLGRRRR